MITDLDIDAYNIYVELNCFDSDGGPSPIIAMDDFIVQRNRIHFNNYYNIIKKRNRKQKITKLDKLSE